jgi:hypothetical protein
VGGGGEGMMIRTCLSAYPTWLLGCDPCHIPDDLMSLWLGTHFQPRSFITIICVLMADPLLPTLPPPPHLPTLHHPYSHHR